MTPVGRADDGDRSSLGLGNSCIPSVGASGHTQWRETMWRTRLVTAAVLSSVMLATASAGGNAQIGSLRKKAEEAKKKLEEAGKKTDSAKARPDSGTAKVDT